MEDRIETMFQRVKSDEGVFGCLEMCDEKDPSRQPITIYSQQGAESKKLCAECMQRMLEHSVDRFIANRNHADDEECDIDLEQLLLGTDVLESILGVLRIQEDAKAVAQWPKVLGSVLMANSARSDP
jgi:hypothetical protein